MNNEEKNIQEENNQVSEKASFADWWAKLASGAKAGIIAALAIIVIIPIVLVIALSGNGNNGGNEGGNSGNTDNNGDGKINYTVTVVDSNGAAVKGAKVTFITPGTDMPWTTDANGKASYKSADTVKVKVTSIPAGYIYSKLNVEQSFAADGTLTVTLEKPDLPDWTIRVVDQDGNAIAGVQVQMCAESCLMPKTTNSEGYVVYEDYEGDYHAQLTALPEGYTAEFDLAAYHDFVDGVATITLIKK